MEHLTQEQIEEIKEILTKWKQELLSESKNSMGEPLSYEGGDEIEKDRTFFTKIRIWYLWNL